MKYRAQPGLVTQPGASAVSKTKTFFIDPASAARNNMSSRDSVTHGDVAGLCDLLLAKGHTKRLYGIIADVTLIK